MMDAHVHTPGRADAALFGQALHCQAQLPADFRIDTGAGRIEHAQSLLRAVAMIEDMGLNEHTHEHEELAPFNLRMEAKLDLNLLLLGRVLEQTLPALPIRSVCWSIRGARLGRLDDEGPKPAPGIEGILQIQLCHWLPEPLELPARLLAADAGHLWLRFPEFATALHDVLERHLFRQHRRQIAQARMG